MSKRMIDWKTAQRKGLVLKRINTELKQFPYIYCMGEPGAEGDAHDLAWAKQQPIDAFYDRPEKSFRWVPVSIEEVSKEEIKDWELTKRKHPMSED